MSDSEYEACINNLGLVEGEEIRLEYVCSRQAVRLPSAWDSERRLESKKGLLVFTNENMIFMQKEGIWGSRYAQALRIPLEQISGVVSGGTLVKHIRISVGFSGTSEQHEFIDFSSIGRQYIYDVRSDIERLLREVREARRRLAQETLLKTSSTTVFCRYCGARNKADQSRCGNCGAVLT